MSKFKHKKRWTIKDLREEMGFTAGDFAKALSLNRITVWRYERNISKPSLHNCYLIIELAHHHGITLTVEDIRHGK